MFLFKSNIFPIIDYLSGESLRLRVKGQVRQRERRGGKRGYHAYGLHYDMWAP